ncbi:hydantoinase B/oxoprolinase family protein [Gilvimarinus sp. SDUM040013]|uniref:Hydantoinase B/oxoprolinase family protein n=1 Tax=Gilvimarinus gilvus TaxID=3058038 RepID=A0ABU4RWR3_9GAMM|nr:hydantoinase B/oxoprolinase family protein [Gilvimarinus sp. SDUM040013]MDO3386518.1 hydantoinase B/oxoprolinase family protein [Gilvimarinus sp. SDUM040013]MDX6849094.1 hydantoinase B/oxoprolinase family protein [Gilvimarinus sp. SDUM040013]
MNAIELSVFASRLSAICDEMGALLKSAAFSPNIKDRLDFSCALFDHRGQLVAQAAHIPVHLGSMAYAMADIVDAQRWRPGDMLVVNDPYLGGTHLPDVTVIAPIYVEQQLIGFSANRAHHANIGASEPGSMPVSQSLAQEGVIIAPTLLVEDGAVVEPVLTRLCGTDTGATHTIQARGDFAAQISASGLGAERLAEQVQAVGLDRFAQAVALLNDYAERLARNALSIIPNGRYQFRDYMDDDGLGQQDVVIAATVDVHEDGVAVDFSGTADQVKGNINCPLSVAAAAAFYVLRCLMPAQTPACAGTFRAIHITAPEGCLVNARRPAAVAAGNVETSTRMVDVLLGALAQALPERIPAASTGSMNNVAMGAMATPDQPRWDYYETNGGGMGAGVSGGGLSGVQTHMTNTLNTPIESLERHYPIRVTRYQLRRDSGGDGQVRGGDGLIREYTFLAPARLTLLTERRRYAPWGLNGGKPGAVGENKINGAKVPAKIALDVKAGDVLTLATAGGGGWGEPAKAL